MSCLFQSVYVLLKNELKDQHQINDANDLRQAVVKYFRENLDQEINGTTISDWLKLIEISDRIPPETYIDRMTLNSTWGGAPEIAVMANLLQVRIYVQRNNGTLAKFIPETDPNEGLVLHLNWTGAHYSPAKRLRFQKH